MNKALIHKFFGEGAWVEGSSLQQLDNLAQLDDTILRLAAMPDLHPGKYGPVGIGMLSSEIHPPLVGSDIGCGMGLYRTDLSVRKIKIEKVADRLKELDQPWDGDTEERLASLGIARTPYDIGLGTIGSGNHFCELQAIQDIHDEEAATAAGLNTDDVFILVHSGSRALGYSVLEDLIRDGHTRLQDDETGQRYLAAHDHAVAWASANRALIAERAADAARTEAQLVADLPHNFLERVEGGFLHRKGAAPADRGLVPIPGSRETLSYLVKPLDTASTDALATLPHGAGRKYDRGSMHGRIQKVKSVREQMTRNPFGGIVVCEDRNLMIEEAGAAYKQIDKVIEETVAQGLASVVATFKPLVTFKTGLSHIGEKDRAR